MDRAQEALGAHHPSPLAPPALAHQPALQPLARLQPQLLAALGLAAPLQHLGRPLHLAKAAPLLLGKPAPLPLVPRVLVHQPLPLVPLRAPQPLGRHPPPCLGQALHRPLAAPDLVAPHLAAHPKARLPLACHRAPLLLAAQALAPQALDRQAHQRLALVSLRHQHLARAAPLHLALPAPEALVPLSLPLHSEPQHLHLGLELQHLLLEAPPCLASHSSSSSNNKPNQHLGLPTPLGRLVLHLGLVHLAHQHLGRAKVAVASLEAFHPRQGLVKLQARLARHLSASSQTHSSSRLLSSSTNPNSN